jgi:hypothetical protein
MILDGVVFADKKWTKNGHETDPSLAWKCVALQDLGLSLTLDISPCSP